MANLRAALEPLRGGEISQPGYGNTSSRLAKKWQRSGGYCTAMVTAFEATPPMLSTTAMELPVGELAGTSTFT